MYLYSVRLLAILFLLSLVPFYSSIAQERSGSLSGKISSQGNSVPGATIQLKGTELGAATNENGSFGIKDIPFGVYEIEIRSIGYEIFSVQVEINSKNVKRDFELVENNLGLKEVVVSGTMSAQYVENSPIKVDVITSRQFQTYLPSGGANLVEGISLVNGVQEEVACGVCFTNSISINGLPGQYTSVLMDGTPMYGNLASVYGLNGIPTMLIDRIEVIKGPNSTLYGSEAVAGLINIITKDPSKQPGFSLDVMGTSHRELFTNLGLSTGIGKTGVFVGVNHGRVDIFEDRNEDGFGDIINMDRASIFTKFDFARPSGKKFTLAAKYYFEDRRNGVKEFLSGDYHSLRGDTSVYGESIYTQRIELFGTYHFNLIKNLRVDYSFSHHDQDSYYGDGHYAATQKIGFGNFIWNKSYSRHNLTLGMTTRLQVYDDNTTATNIETPEGDYENNEELSFIPGLMVQDEYFLSPKTTILAGLRLDYYQHHGTIFSPRISTKHSLGSFTNLRFNFGTGFRVVNLFTEDHAFITGQRDIVIVEDLAPEQSYNFTANLNHVFLMGNGQGMLDFDVFYTYFTNKINPDYSDPGKIIYGNSDGNSISKGIGARWVHEFSIPFSLSAGVTFMDVTETEGDETNSIPFAPVYSGVLTASYSIRGLGLQFSYSSNLTGPMALPEVYDLDANGDPLADPRTTTSEPFAIHNLKVEKSIGKLFFIYGGITNFLDYYQPVSPLVGYNDPNFNPGFSPNFDTSYSYSPIHGREFFLGLRMNIGS